MPNDQNRNFSDEKEFTEIESLVKEAKELENSDKLKEAKNKFLDAAEIALKLSKSKTGMDKLTYENIASALVQYAKDIKLLMESIEHPLPEIPTGKSKEKAGEDKKETTNKTQKRIPVNQILTQLLVLREGGTPIFSYVNEFISDATKNKIDDILVSGAITAVNSLMQEIMEEPIQKIQFAEGVLYYKLYDDLIFVVFTKSSGADLNKVLELFIKEFDAVLTEKMKQQIAQGMDMRNNEGFNKVVKRLLSHSIEAPGHTG